MMMLLMDMKKNQMSSHMSDWKFKIHNIKNQSGTSFHQTCKESKLTIWTNDAKNPDKGRKSCTPTEYVTVTMDMCKNTPLPIFKGEQPGPNYYLFPDNIYDLGIHYAINNICSIYTWTESEGKKRTNKIAAYVLICINDKGYYYQSYHDNNKINGIAIIVDKWGGNNKNNLMIHFLNMIKEGKCFETATLYLYIKGHKIVTATAHLTSLRCYNRSKMSLLLRSAVKFWIPEIMLKWFKYYMKFVLTWNHSRMIYTIELILKLS